MKNNAAILAITFSLLCVFPGRISMLTQAQDRDQSLLNEINQIKAIDNHAHVMSSAADEDFDAIACGGLEFVAPPPMRLRPDNPIYTGAWRELYGYNGGDHLKGCGKLIPISISFMARKRRY